MQKGIDIGGTKMRAVWWDGKKVLKAKEVPTPKTLKDFKAVLEDFMKFAGGKANIGAAGVISGRKLVLSPNIKYLKNFYFETKLDNDARCFARAEYFFGAARGEKNAFFLTLGTGIGRAAGKGGKILKIKKLEYPERWEKEYQKFRAAGNDKKLAEFLAKKFPEIIKLYKPEVIIVGGGVSMRKGFLKLLRKKIGVPIKKSSFGKNAAAIGAAEM